MAKKLNGAVQIQSLYRVCIAELCRREMQKGMTAEVILQEFKRKLLKRQIGFKLETSL